MMIGKVIKKSVTYKQGVGFCFQQLLFTILNINDIAFREKLCNYFIDTYKYIFNSMDIISTPYIEVLCDMLNKGLFGTVSDRMRNYCLSSLKDVVNEIPFFLLLDKNEHKEHLNKTVMNNINKITYPSFAGLKKELYNSSYMNPYYELLEYSFTNYYPKETFGKTISDFVNMKPNLCAEYIKQCLEILLGSNDNIFVSFEINRTTEINIFLNDKLVCYIDIQNKQFYNTISNNGYESVFRENVILNFVDNECIDYLFTNKNTKTVNPNYYYFIDLPNITAIFDNLISVIAGLINIGGFMKLHKLNNIKCNTINACIKSSIKKDYDIHILYMYDYAIALINNNVSSNKVSDDCADAFIIKYDNIMEDINNFIKIIEKNEC
jgi:hypothetical protein